MCSEPTEAVKDKEKKQQTTIKSRHLDLIVVLI